MPRAVARRIDVAGVVGLVVSGGLYLLVAPSFVSGMPALLGLFAFQGLVMTVVAIVHGRWLRRAMDRERERPPR